MRRAPKLTFGSTVAVTLVATMMIGLMAPAASATIVIPKPFTMTVSPSTTTAGTSKQFTATFKNWWLQKMGSADLSVPAAFAITGVVTSRGTYSVVGNVVKLRNLNLSWLHAFTVKVTATAACTPSASNVWSAAAKTGAGFTGSSFLLLTPSSHRSVAVTGSCSLAFVAGHQPADTGPGATITSVASDPGGPPVQVGVYDGANNLITGGSPVTILMAIDTNPGGGTLSGDTDVDTAAGVASFADLSIDQPGDGYKLAASAGALSTTSSAFNIAGLVMECEAGEDCSGTLSDGGTGGTVTALDTGSDAVLTMSLTPAGTLGEINCADYEEQSSELTFNLTGSSGKRITMSFDTDEYYADADDYQVCFQSDTPFLDRYGDTTNLGLLPECEIDYESFVYVPPVPPCVDERNEDGSFVYLTFLAPPGDPKGRV